MRDCALVLYKYAFLFVPECGVPRQVVQRLSIGPAPSGMTSPKHQFLVPAGFPEFAARC